MALTQYELSKSFWDFVFENPEKVKTTHIAIFFFAVEHCNRLGWKEKFGLPTSMTLEAIGVKSYNSYKKHFDDLVEWEVIKVIEYSKNQYSSNIIALSIALSKKNKALVKATKKHSESTIQSTGESTGSIDKPITNNQITYNDDDDNRLTPPPQIPIDGFRSIESLKLIILSDRDYIGLVCQKGIEENKVPEWLDAFNRFLKMQNKTLKQETDYRLHFPRWLVKVPNYRTMNPKDYNPMGNEVPQQSTLTPTEQALKNKYGNQL